MCGSRYYLRARSVLRTDSLSCLAPVVVVG